MTIPYRAPASFSLSCEPPVAEDKNSKAGNKIKAKLATFSKAKTTRLAL